MNYIKGVCHEKKIYNNYKCNNYFGNYDNWFIYYDKG